MNLGLDESQLSLSNNSVLCSRSGGLSGETVFGSLISHASAPLPNLVEKVSVLFSRSVQSSFLPD